ncbi:hypothetical protein HY612_03330 [Candidatus Roizmanbacteria bacterium]|nr:hypothetical protein [Candidatus Roizmanbacteria bacterium]
MSKNNLFILLLGIFILLLIIVGLMIVGNPVSQQGLRYDELRLSDFFSIKYRVESYYKNNNALPPNLQSLSNQSNLKILDPETKKPYTYLISSSMSYRLCTVFSTDSLSSNNQSSYNDSNLSNQHKKGYDCITYTIPN